MVPEVIGYTDTAMIQDYSDMCHMGKSGLLFVPFVIKC